MRVRRRLLLASLLACSLGSCGGDSEPAADLGPQLLEAARAGDGTQVRALLGRGAEVESRDSTGATALVAAAYGNHVDVARLLVEAGADVNAKDESEQSAYLIATSEVGDDARLFELALANGAEVDATDSYNGTGLIRAAERGHWRRRRPHRRPGHDAARPRAPAGLPCDRADSRAGRYPRALG